MVDYPHIGRAAQANRELEGLDDDSLIDDLLAACEAAHDLLTRIHDGRLGHHKDNPVPVQLRAAIAKAKGE